MIGFSVTFKKKETCASYLKTQKLQLEAIRSPIWSSGRQRARARERERERDRQTDRQTDETEREGER